MYEQIKVEIPYALNVEYAVANNLLTLQEDAQAFPCWLAPGGAGGCSHPTHHLVKLYSQTIDEPVDGLDVCLAWCGWTCAKLILCKGSQRTGMPGQVDPHHPQQEHQHHSPQPDAPSPLRGLVRHNSIGSTAGDATGGVPGCAAVGSSPPAGETAASRRPPGLRLGGFLRRHFPGSPRPNRKTAS